MLGRLTKPPEMFFSIFLQLIRADGVGPFYGPSKLMHSWFSIFRDFGVRIALDSVKAHFPNQKNMHVLSFLITAYFGINTGR